MERIRGCEQQGQPHGPPHLIRCDWVDREEEYKKCSVNLGEATRWEFAPLRHCARFPLHFHTLEGRVPPHTMDAWLGRLCSVSTCCSSRGSETGERDGSIFERHLRESHPRGAPTTRRGFDPTGAPGSACRGQDASFIHHEASAASHQHAKQRGPAGEATCQVTAAFVFEAEDASPFPPDPYPDLSVQPGDRLTVFPAMTQYGWVFAVDNRAPQRRGWVPGNYVTLDGIEPYLKTGGDEEAMLWSQVRSERAGATAVGAQSWMDAHKRNESAL